jgi:hypothetical protein
VMTSFDGVPVQPMGDTSDLEFRGD